MIRIAICDDDSTQLKLLSAATDRYFENNPSIAMERSVYTTPYLLLEDLGKTGGWDIVLLDICMPGITGIEVAREIRRFNAKAEIIFFSVSKDFAVEAFSVNALHYILKPFTDKEFDEAMSRAIELYHDKPPKKLLVQMDNGHVQAVDIDDILYVESVSYRRMVHTASATYAEAKKTLSKISEELEDLSPGQFIQPYRGYIANMNAIRTITAEKVVMENGDSILIKRGDFRRLRERFFQWSFRRSGDE